MAITRGGKAKATLEKLGYKYDTLRERYVKSQQNEDDEQEKVWIDQRLAASAELAHEETAGLVLDVFSLRGKYMKKVQKLRGSWVTPESLFLADLRETREAQLRAEAVDRIESVLGSVL